MLKSEKTTINGVDYEVTKLPYTPGRKLLLRLYKVLGPALSGALERAPKNIGADISEIKIGELIPSFSSLVNILSDTLQEEDFDYMVSTLAEYTSVGTDGKLTPLKSKIEFHFSGNYGEMFSWLAFALRVNYLSFLDARGGLSNFIKRAAVAVQESPSQNI